MRLDEFNLVINEHGRFIWVGDWEYRVFTGIGDVYSLRVPAAYHEIIGDVLLGVECL